jgi:hypothetical protein
VQEPWIFACILLRQCRGTDQAAIPPGPAPSLVEDFKRINTLAGLVGEQLRADQRLGVKLLELGDSHGSPLIFDIRFS